MLTIPREICRDLEQALTREWIVTNGEGGYASSSIVGANTRRYHGLLVAALKPPAARTVILSKLDEEVQVGGSTYRLGTNEYESGTVYPDGFLFLERVELDGMIPTFVYRSASFELAKTVWMEQGQNTTFIRYTLAASSPPIVLTLLPLCTYRDFHAETHGSIDWHFAVEQAEGVVAFTAFPGAKPLRLLPLPKADFSRLDLWYWRFRHRAERERGLDSTEDLNLPGLLRAELGPGDCLTLVASTEEASAIDRNVDAAYGRAVDRQAAIRRGASGDFEEQLKLAADQFVVRRQVEKEALNTVIAGYHWFGDWGRDTMIALEGLTLLTGRAEEARNILRAFGRYVDQGMLPNRFPDAGVDAAPVEYNTVDATLWYFHAIDRYVSATGDTALVDELWPVLTSIVDWHVKGTRYNIHVDAADGLLYAGAPDVQLTWMDAKAGDWVVTPRIGKPVEINALWYHALVLMDHWAKAGRAGADYQSLAARTRHSFDRFWYAAGGYLYDVIDSPNGSDASLRPNQLFAISLERDLVPDDRAKLALDRVTESLLTPFGLRTLSPRDPNYRSRYTGDRVHRDGAYHQGLVWTWLLGAYVDAVKAHGNPASLPASLEPLRAHLAEAGIGTLGEIFEPEPPYRAVGSIAQAWSVAEVLRALRALK